MKNQTVAWFSAGVSSAVAVKLIIDEIDEIYFIEIDDHHPDTERFLSDCEDWFDFPIKRLASAHTSVENACYSSRYINGVAGASCTRLLKKRPRKEWEMDFPRGNSLTYVWGLDSNEKHRVDRIKSAMPNCKHIFPLIDKGIEKKEAHEILSASGIERPEMYKLGYANNNCIGCVKGGKGYWNKIRIDFPDIFDSRALMERKIGASCINGVYLDELPPKSGRMSKPILDDCGIFCEIMKLS